MLYCIVQSRTKLESHQDLLSLVEVDLNLD